MYDDGLARALGRLEALGINNVGEALKGRVAGLLARLMGVPPARISTSSNPSSVNRVRASSVRLIEPPRPDASLLTAIW